MAAELKVTVDVRIPRWKRALIDACVWILNRVVASIGNNARVI